MYFYLSSCLPYSEDWDLFLPERLKNFVRCLFTSPLYTSSDPNKWFQREFISIFEPSISNGLIHQDPYIFQGRVQWLEDRDPCSSSYRRWWYAVCDHWCIDENQYCCRYHWRRTSNDQEGMLNGLMKIKINSILTTWSSTLCIKLLIKINLAKLRCALLPKRYWENLTQLCEGNDQTKDTNFL